MYNFIESERYVGYPYCTLGKPNRTFGDLSANYSKPNWYTSTYEWIDW